MPRDLDIVAAADETGDDAEKHLARLVLLEGELWNPVQPSPDLDQVKHGPLRRRYRRAIRQGSQSTLASADLFG